jgi:LPS O-antigen subunit length determinant protein (WzzB/FepE family)
VPRQIPPDERGFRWYPFTFEEMTKELYSQLDAWIRAVRTRTWSHSAASFSMKLRSAWKLSLKSQLPEDVEKTLRGAIASREEEIAKAAGRLRRRTWSEVHREELKALAMFGTEKVRAAAVSALLENFWGKR